MPMLDRINRAGASDVHDVHCADKSKARRGGVTNSRPTITSDNGLQRALWLKGRYSRTRHTSANTHCCRAFAPLPPILHSCRKIGRPVYGVLRRGWLPLRLSLARREGAPGGQARRSRSSASRVTCSRWSIPGHGPPRLMQRPIESEARKGSSTSGGARAGRTGIHRGTVRSETDGFVVVGSCGDAASGDA